MDHAWRLLLPISPCWDNVRWQTATWLNAGGISHPEVSVGQMCCRIGGIDGLFAIDFNDTAVLYVPHILQLVEDVPCFVFNQDGRVRGLQHSRCQLLREHVHDKCVQGLQTVELVSDMNTSGLIAKLQEKDTWGETERSKKKVRKDHHDEDEKSEAYAPKCEIYRMYVNGISNFHLFGLQFYHKLTNLMWCLQYLSSVIHKLKR